MHNFFCCHCSRSFRTIFFFSIQQAEQIITQQISAYTRDSSSSIASSSIKQYARRIRSRWQAERSRRYCVDTWESEIISGREMANSQEHQRSFIRFHGSVHSFSGELKCSSHDQEYFHLWKLQGTANLQSSINATDSLGTISLSAIYGALVVSCSFLPTLIIRKLTVKWALFFSMMCYAPYIAAQFYPRFYTLIPVS